MMDNLLILLSSSKHSSMVRVAAGAAQVQNWVPSGCQERPKGCFPAAAPVFV